ncbi:MAG: hypothetical protein EZS28_046960 [Streblomastix strix]|uniref:Uncharacterized protein n=1 Tax=Streblomastix strix TaxID=222440 RepID=A0A5J4TIE2_9EUKA|nr:MAG: hypothetical protein EZS28_046960 [Streblomastix strix]
MKDSAELMSDANMILNPGSSVCLFCYSDVNSFPNILIEERKKKHVATISQLSLIKNECLFTIQQKRLVSVIIYYELMNYFCISILLLVRQLIGYPKVAAKAQSIISFDLCSCVDGRSSVIRENLGDGRIQ